MTRRTPRKRHRWSVPLGWTYDGCGFCGCVRRRHRLRAESPLITRYLNPQPNGQLWTRKPRPCFEVVA